MTKTKKNMTKIFEICSIVAVVAAGTAYAYFTDNETQTNVFTVGEVTTNLYESTWDGEVPDGPNVTAPDPAKVDLGINQAKDLWPTKVVNKNPAIKNTGINPAYVYLEITVPKASVITAKPDGSRNQRAETQLFNFVKNTGWTQQGTVKTVGSNNVYVYAYDKILKKGEVATTLFDTVTFCNLIEGEIPVGTVENIGVKSMAIQSDGTGTASEAYAKYLNQNK